MQSNLAKNIRKIRSAFGSMSKLPKAVIKYGLYTSLVIFIISSIMVLLVNTILPFDTYFDMVSKEIFKASFTLAAEAVIGGLIMDFIFRK